MKLTTISAITLFCISAQADTTSLIDALRNHANATKFADFLIANPDILAVYNSSSVQTIFAPTDDHFAAPVRRRDTSSQQQQLQYQYTNDLTGLENLAPTSLPGAIVHSGLKAPQTGGTQAIISEKVAANSTARRRDVPSTGIRMRSGLGNGVNILQGDIKYSNGLIHTTDGFFTIPSALSSTLSSTGLSSLGSLLSSANLTSTIDSSDSITIFTPSNAAFAAASNSTSDPATLPKILSNHVIPNFLGYLPALVDGASYKTLAGETLTISIKNGVYFVNGAKIIASNTIINNGVAHTIDKVLLPTPTPVFSGSESLTRGNSALVAVTVAALAMLLI